MSLVPVPLLFVTATFTVPVPEGSTAVIFVELFRVNVAPVVPNLTAETVVKFVPLMTTEVPPIAGPSVGVTLVTVGLLKASSAARDDPDFDFGPSTFAARRRVTSESSDTRWRPALSDEPTAARARTAEREDDPEPWPEPPWVT